MDTINHVQHTDAETGAQFGYSLATAETIEHFIEAFRDGLVCLGSAHDAIVCAIYTGEPFTPDAFPFVRRKAEEWLRAK